MDARGIIAKLQFGFVVVEDCCMWHEDQKTYADS